MSITNKHLLIISGFEANGFAGTVRDIHISTAFGISASIIITTLTAQNANRMTVNHAVPVAVIIEQLKNLMVIPQVIKIGVLPNREISTAIAQWLQTLSAHKPQVILDPIYAGSGDGARFSENTLTNILDPLLPFTDLLTPNNSELQRLTHAVNKGSSVETNIVNYFNKQPTFRGVLFVKSVFKNASAPTVKDILAKQSCTKEFIYFSQPKQNTLMRGTGCLLSTAIACALCEGYPMESAIALASAYLSRELSARRGSKATSTALPQTGWPIDVGYYPHISSTYATFSLSNSFPVLDVDQGLYPIVDSSKWILKLAKLGVKTIQLRIKDKPLYEVRDEVRRAIDISQKFKLQLFINDYWQLAIELGAYGVHLGQEDLQFANLEKILKSGLRLGVSTHGDYEFLLARNLRPSYLAVGAIFPTQTKDMSNKIQGLNRLKRYCQMAGTTPIVAIGGINIKNIEQVLEIKPNFIAVVSAITQSPTPEKVTVLLMQHVQSENSA